MWAEEPLCRSMGRETEVYRFTWRSSFDGDAVVRIGRQDDEITLRWAYGRFRPSEVDDAPGLAALTLAEWAALIVASFWALDPEERCLGLDGTVWLIEGRCKDIYRAVSRWSPDAEIYDLGKLFFELARLAPGGSRDLLKSHAEPGAKPERA